jgi:hypothetical protein
MPQKVIDTYQSFLSEFNEPPLIGNQAIAHFRLGEYSNCDSLLVELVMRNPREAALLTTSPMVYAQRGEINTSLEWLEEAYQKHELHLMWLNIEPLFKPLHTDRRFEELLRKIGFPE